MSRARILLIYSGGTIGMVKDYKTGALQAFNFDQLIQRIPELSHLNVTISTVAFEKPLDSSNMHPETWVKLAEIIEKNYSRYDGFVVLHGSDTMSYTASALSFMFENLGKPIIFTGSQLPIGDLRTDAKENVITSIQLASLKNKGNPVITEVGLYFEFKLYRANRTTKLSAEQFNAFTSMNYPVLAQSGVHLQINKQDLLAAPKKNKSLKVYKTPNSRVALIKMFPGIGKEVIHCILSNTWIKAVVLETYGAGNAPTESWFYDEIKNALDKQLIIVNISQCIGGSVQQGLYQTSAHLKELGVISGADMTTEAALTKLMVLMGRNLSHSKIQKLMLQPLRGEMV